MIVVSNSSPLISFAKIGKLQTLKELFGKITIPKSVWCEVVVRDKLSVEVLKGEIEVGEAEAIVLAKELNADLLIMDENIPRVIAESIGLRVVGSLAVLYIAKKRGLIKENFDEIVKELRAKGVRFSDNVINRLKQKWKDKSDFNF